MSEGKLSSRGARIVKALNQFADDLAAGTPIETKYTVRRVRVIPRPSLYPPRGSHRAGVDRGKPRGFRTIIGSKSDDNPIMGTGITSALPDRAAIPRRNRHGTGPLPGTHSRRSGRWRTVKPGATIRQARKNHVHKVDQPHPKPHGGRPGCVSTGSQ